MKHKGRLLAWLLCSATGCAGGQTGEPGSGPALVCDADAVTGDDAEQLFARFDGAYEGGCGAEPRICTNELRLTPSGSISWADGAERVPDRVYVYYQGLSTPSECEFSPSAGPATEYRCPEGSAGRATLRVFFQARHWDTAFEVTGDDCHAALLRLDVELDPTGGEP